MKTPMLIKVFSDRSALSNAAASKAATAIRHAISQRGSARIIAATGASQFEFLEALTNVRDIDWTKVEMFHLDEYVGLAISHRASFRKYLLERLIQRTGIANYHLLDGESDPVKVCRDVGSALSASSAPVDVAFVGIGENGHLAFNDPPADFETDDAYIVVQLDEACRLQQVREGWFSSLAEVPAKAISMTIRQILKSQTILCIVPDARKAKAVQACFAGEISPMAPASILRTHHDTTVFLDTESAQFLKAQLISEK